jgi:phage/plasmid-like protein (TIGR03299 family)
MSKSIETIVFVDDDKIQHMINRKNISRLKDSLSLHFFENPYDALKWFEPWTEHKLIALNTAGSLQGGKKVWVLGQVVKDTIMDITGKDSVAKFVMLSNSHDGTAAVRLGLCGIRIVCQNTMYMAHHSSESKLVRIRHSSQMKQNMEVMRDVIDLVNADFAATAEQYKWLTTRHINQRDLKKYIRVLVQGEKDAEKPFDDVSTRTKNIIAKIEARMDMPNQKISSGSWWAAYNAFNEILNHEYGRNSDNRLSNLWFGQNATLNKQAFELAMQMAA